MRQLVIMSLLFISMSALAMQSIRTAITSKPLTGAAVAAGLGSVLTLASIRETSLRTKNPIHAFKKRVHDRELREIRLAIAQEYATMYTMPGSDR